MFIGLFFDSADQKQGRATDYVKRQYIGNLGKIENFISVLTQLKLNFV